MKCPEVIVNNLGTIITAATPIALAWFTWWSTRRQSRDLKKHSDENAEKTSKAAREAVAEATGVFKVPPEQ